MNKMDIIYVNIILNNNQYGLTKDAQLLVKYLDNILNKKVKIRVRPVSNYSYQTGYVDINIFLETLNPVLFHYAKINILIPNPEWFYQDWVPYLENIDSVWAKTKYSYDLFSKHCSKVEYISWTSLDRFKKKFH